MLAALNASGTTSIKAKKSRNHTELLFKYLKIPIKVKKTKKFDFIDIKKPKKINAFNYQIPGDISSSAFFISIKSNFLVFLTLIGIFKYLKSNSV